VGTERKARTRDAFTEIGEQLGKGRFTRQSLQDLMFSNRDYIAEQTVADTVRMCRSMSGDVAEACAVLSTWEQGATYLHVVAFDGDRCPDTATLLAYSQSGDRTSAHYSDQTKLYSKKGWVTERFCDKDILASPELQVIEVRQH